MKNTSYNKTQRGNKVAPHCLSPQQQLWGMIDPCNQNLVRLVFRRLKKRDQEDLCYAMVAFLRYGIKRDFDCPFLQVLFQSFVDVVKDRSANSNVKPLKPKK